MDKAALRALLSAHPPRKLTSGRRAAVLVPILFGDVTRVLFMKRPDNSSTHAGQVAFPGGRPEPQDSDLIATALREANEELGIDPARVEVLGALDDINTHVTDYDVTPVVGALHGEPELSPNEEVADWFWVELADLLNANKWRGMDIERGGKTFHIWFFDGAKHVIWGATAAMTRTLVEWIWDDMP